MALIYVVTSGCYSDYGIDAIFLTEEAARAYCPDQDNDGYGRRIEVYTLDDPTGEHSTDRRVWHVRMNYRTGDVENATVTERLDPDEPDGTVFATGHYSPPKDPLFRVDVMASTKEQAIKAANERRAMHKAHSLNASTASS